MYVCMFPCIHVCMYVFIISYSNVCICVFIFPQSIVDLLVKKDPSLLLMVDNRKRLPLHYAVAIGVPGEQ